MMNVTIHTAASASYRQMLTSLSAVLGKGATFAAERGIDELVLLQSRLAPDMLPLVRQVQIAADQARNGMARLGGFETAQQADDEAGFQALQARIADALAAIDGFPAAAFEGAADRTVTIKLPSRTLSFGGVSFLFGFSLPNFYFHVTTAYAILRHNGVAVGKADFVGSVI